MSPSIYQAVDQPPVSFKHKKPFAIRKQEASDIREKYPEKIPLIVEKYQKETSLPKLEKSKFLVPKEITVSQFVTIIRNRMQLHPNQAFYLLINNRAIPSMSSTLAELYRDDKDRDGYLYMTYASHEMFG